MEPAPPAPHGDGASVDPFPFPALEGRTRPEVAALLTALGIGTRLRLERHTAGDRVAYDGERPVLQLIGNADVVVPVRAPSVVCLDGLPWLREVGVAVEHLLVFGARGVAPLRDLRALRSLRLAYATDVFDPELPSRHSLLETLELAEVRSVRAWYPVGEFRSLRRLALYGADQLEDLTCARALTRLEHLAVYGSEQLHRLSGISGAEQLNTVVLDACPMLGLLEPLASLPSLRSLTLSRCDELGYLGALENCDRLVRLSLAGSGDLALPNLSSLHHLEELDLRGCRRIENLDAARACSRKVRVLCR